MGIERERIENPCVQAIAKNKIVCGHRTLEALDDERVRLEAEATFISPGTDLHFISETHTKPSTFPFTPGYSYIGRVIAMGAKVSGINLGQRFLCSAGHCRFANLLPKELIAVPDGLDPVEASAAIVMGIALRGVRGGQIRLGDSVVVFGQGVIGMYAAHLAKVAGAYPVIAVDPIAKRGEIAKTLGVDVFLDPRKCDVRAEVLKATGGEGARVSIDATGTTKVIATLPSITADNGRLVVLGGIHGTVEIDLYTRFQKGNLTMVGCGTAFPTDYPYTAERNVSTLMAMSRAGIVRPRPAITHVVPWTQAPEMYRLLLEEKDKAIGVALDWRER